MSKFKVGDYLTLDETFWAYDSHPESGLIMPTYIVVVTQIEMNSYIYTTIGPEEFPHQVENSGLVDLFYRKLTETEIGLIKLLYG